MEGWMDRPYFIGPFQPRPGVQLSKLNVKNFNTEGTGKTQNENFKKENK